jgi:hypothetical protein
MRVKTLYMRTYVIYVYIERKREKLKYSLKRPCPIVRIDNNVPYSMFPTDREELEG